MFRSDRAGERFLATILFTDIVGSTDLAAKLGDRGWRRLVAAHHKAVRGELRRYGGRELDTAGDGFFATFGQPAQAVRAAAAIVAAIAGLGVSIRAGLHTGEAERIGPKIGGIAVHIASRILAAAEPGEILVSGTVRDLVAGSGLEFIDRGVHDLRGVPGEWHLWALVTEIPELDESSVGAIVRTPEPRAARTSRRPWIVAGLIALAGAIVASVLGANLLRSTSPPGPSPSSSPAPSFVLRPDTVVVLDQATGALVDVRSVGQGPDAIAIDGSAIWVGNLDAGTLVHLDAADPSATQTIGRVGRPTSIAVGNGIVWTEDGFDGSLTLIDGATGAVRDTLAGIHLRRIAYGFEALWGTDDIGDRLTRFDRQTGQATVQVALTSGSYPTGIAIGPDAVWVANIGTQTVTRVDPTSGRAVADGIALRGAPDGIAASATDVWVTSRNSDLLMRLDPATNSVTATVTVCDAPSAVAADGTGVWVACAGSREVWHVRQDGQVLSRLAVGGRPSDIAIGGGRIWVTIAPP